MATAPNETESTPDLAGASRPVAPRRLPSLIRQWDGALTRQLLLQFGRHGIGMMPESMQVDRTTTATCGYCSTGCGLRLHLHDEEAVGLTPETTYPVNLGMACPKGWEALRVLDADDRATMPLLRGAGGQRQPVDWDTALREFCGRFREIQEKHGRGSVAFLSTGQIPCEEMAFLGALAKFGMGLVHGDGNTRQCMATAVTAYKESFGFDAPPYTYADFELSDCLVFVGANPCIAHPIMWERVLKNQTHRELIVIDPRRTETAMAATEHLQLKPKTDLVLLYGIANLLIERGFADRLFIEEHTRGFEAMAQHVAQFPLDRVAATTGLEADQIRRTADIIGQSSAASFWWTMGVNQSYEGTRTAQAVINLALMTGNIGRPGTGANSITGQCNAMGSRLWSNTTNLFGGHRFESAKDRQKIAGVLGIDAERVPREAGWSYDRIMQGIRGGEIRGLWVIGTNPAHSWIQQGDARELLDRLDFLVVQDMYETTETAQHADLVLPAAGWGEKEGTFINSERRYGLLKKVRRSPGQSLADFHIFRAIAHYWGCDDLFRQWTDPEAVFRLMQAASRGQPCDISGVEGYEQIDAMGGMQWPWRQADAAAGGVPETERRLFADGNFFHDDRRARFIVDAPAANPEPVDRAYPLMLLTGRATASQWHTQTRTSKSPVLRQLYPNQPYVEVHGEDAQRANIVNGQRVRIRSRRGTAVAIAVVTPTVGRGQLFMPMHYAETNQLTLSHFDPHSKQPSYKNCAVRLETL